MIGAVEKSLSPTKSAPITLSSPPFAPDVVLLAAEAIKAMAPCGVVSGREELIPEVNPYSPCVPPPLKPGILPFSFLLPEKPTPLLLSVEQLPLPQFDFQLILL
ncbi:MAG: hypothetical protein RRY34_07985, partial [Victivallaceae bacterium]